MAQNSFAPHVLERESDLESRINTSISAGTRVQLVAGNFLILFPIVNSREMLVLAMLYFAPARELSLALLSLGHLSILYLRYHSFDNQHGILNNTLTIEFMTTKLVF